MELDLQDWVIEAFLIKRDNRPSVSDQDYLKADKLNITDENLKTKFKDILKKYLCDESSNLSVDLNNYYPYMTDDSKEKNYKITKENVDDLNNYFNNLIEVVIDDTIEGNVISDNFSKYYAMVINFSHGDQNIVIFRKLKRVTVGKFIGGIFDGSVKELANDLLFVDDSIDFVYFVNFIVDGRTNEERKKLNNYILVYNRRNFEVVFKINEYRITKSEEFFNKYSFIEIADIETDKEYEDGTKLKLKGDIVEDGRLNSQITRINNISSDEITFDKIKQIKEERGNKYSFNIVNNKIKIDDKAQIKDLIDLIDEKIGFPDWNRTKLVRYPNKGEDL